VVTMLRWQTNIMALLLNKTTIDLNNEPLDMGFYLAMSLESSPRSGLDVNLVWTRLPHSLDTQSTPHPQTLECVHADLTSTATATGCSAKVGPMGRDVGFSIIGAKTFSVIVKVSGLECFSENLKFFSQNI
jgi:hypothetical protein